MTTDKTSTAMDNLERIIAAFPKMSTDNGEAFLRDIVAEGLGWGTYDSAPDGTPKHDIETVVRRLIERARPCTRHTEHNIRPGDGLVGRYFPDSTQFPNGTWEFCDSNLGEYVYCGSHRTAHATGWCTVPNRNKTPLRATTRDEAFSECRARGFGVRS